MLDHRMLHFWMQPVHYLIRMLHIVSMAAFFGVVIIIDCSLLAGSAQERLQPIADLVLPLLHGTFLLSLATGIALFLYDPVHVGSRAYFLPKLAFIAGAMLLAGWKHRKRYKSLIFNGKEISIGARICVWMSIILWTGVIVLSCFNTEAVPKVFLR
jgi:hypothetical protein